MSRVRELVHVIREGDDAMVEETILRLSRSRRWLAPLSLVVGAFVILFTGLRLVFSNWRLTLVQVLPATWIWLAMLDLKLHVLHGKSFHVLTGPVVIPLVAAVAAVTAASFFLNATFAFAIAGGHPPEVRRGIAGARAQLRTVLGSGVVIGLLLAFSTVIVTRWGKPWFALSLSAVIAIMMVAYVALPPALIGMRKPERSRRDRLVASAISGGIGTAVTMPPYALGRAGILMLGSQSLLVPGIVLLAVGFALQSGATGAVKAITMSASLATVHPARDAGPEPEPQPVP
jgi:hypothetical protein